MIVTKTGLPTYVHTTYIPPAAFFLGATGDFLPVAIKISSAVIRPKEPVPLSVFKSNPASAASLLA